MFGTDKPGETMTVAMNPADAERWFGVAPPDLSVTARARGADWLYTYFMTFYRDPARPTGVNNLAFKDVAMPHVLWELQGWQRPVYREEGTGAQAVRISGTRVRPKRVTKMFCLTNRPQSRMSLIGNTGGQSTMMRV